MPDPYHLKALRNMGISVSELGCVMLDCWPVDLTDVIPEKWAYRSTHPDRRWIDGVQTEAHVTLLYGLLSNAHLIREAIDEVMSGWRPDSVKGDMLTVFPSPFTSKGDEEPYSCIVSEVARTPALRDAHARLSMLPHIDTHWEYRPHVTLAYVHRDYEQEALLALREHFHARDVYVPIRFEPIGLNYGYLPHLTTPTRDTEDSLL